MVLTGSEGGFALGPTCWSLATLLAPSPPIRFIESAAVEAPLLSPVGRFHPRVSEGEIIRLDKKYGLVRFKLAWWEGFSSTFLPNTTSVNAWR
jgi:hypothetical protein